MSALSIVKVYGIPCRVLHLFVFSFSLLSNWKVIRETMSQLMLDWIGKSGVHEAMPFVPKHEHSSWQWSYVDVCRLRHLGHAYIFSHTSPLQKKTKTNNQTNKDKENQHKQIQFAVKHGDEARNHAKNFLSACKQQLNAHLWGHSHGICPKCLHRNSNSKKTFCIFFLLSLMQLNNWETRTRGSFLLTASTCSGGVCLNIWRKKTFAHKEVQWKCTPCPAETPSVLYQPSETIDKSWCPMAKFFPVL